MRTTRREGFILLLGVSALLAVHSPRTAIAVETYPYCQILDVLSDPLYEVSLAYVSESRFRGYGKATMLELSSDWEFAYFRNVMGGNLEARLEGGAVIFTKSAGLHLPDQLLHLGLDAGWTQRSPRGIGFQVRAEPGIYADMEKLDGELFALPVSLAVVRTFNPSCSGILGFTVRPDFDRWLMPMIGVEWEICETLRLAARLPESRFTWYMSRDWTTHIGFEWRDSSYYVEERGPEDRDQITLEDMRLYWGLRRRISEQFHVMGEIGRMFDRDVRFEGQVGGVEDDVDVESRYFARLAVLGPF